MKLSKLFVERSKNLGMLSQDSEKKVFSVIFLSPNI